MSQLVCLLLRLHLGRQQFLRVNKVVLLLGVVVGGGGGSFGGGIGGDGVGVGV